MPLESLVPAATTWATTPTPNKIRIRVPRKFGSTRTVATTVTRVTTSPCRTVASVRPAPDTTASSTDGDRAATGSRSAVEDSPAMPDPARLLSDVVVGPGQRAVGLSSLSAWRTCGSSVPACRWRNRRAARVGRRGVRRNNVRPTARARVFLRMARGPRERLETSGRDLPVAASEIGDAGELPVVASRRPRPGNHERRIRNGRSNGRTRDTTCFAGASSLAATSFTGVRSETRRPVAARTTFPGNSTTSPMRVVWGTMPSRRGARAALFVRSHRAVDERASAITRAVTTTNPTTVNVSEATAGSPPMRPRVFRLPVVRCSCLTIHPIAHGIKGSPSAVLNRYEALSHRPVLRRRCALTGYLDAEAEH
jgi:hypothetical protein